MRYVLEGSVRKSGRRVRVTAQLIRADTNHHIMAERYDRDLTDLFELQDEIAHAIAGAIEPELLKFERERIADRPQHSEDAYELYQRGMWHHYRHNKADNVEAQAFFRRALAIDPQYPQATAALAIARLQCGLSRLGGDAEANYAEATIWRSARSLSTPATRMPVSRSAASACGRAVRSRDRGVRGGDQAQPELCRRPRPARAMYLYAGRPEETIGLAEKGIRLSPSDPRLFIWLACPRRRSLPAAPL